MYRHLSWKGIVRPMLAGVARNVPMRRSATNADEVRASCVRCVASLVYELSIRTWLLKVLFWTWSCIGVPLFFRTFHVHMACNVCCLSDALQKVELELEPSFVAFFIENDFFE